jgi:hypothetical protein
LAFIIERKPYAAPQGATELANALREDLFENLASQPVKLSQEQFGDVYPQADVPVLVTYSDVPGLPFLSVEGAIDELEHSDVVIGAAPDGALYLVALRPGLQGEVAELVKSGGVVLTELTDLLDDLELKCTVLPPWFRMASAQDLSFAENLARLSVMGEDGAEDVFFADRLRMWFETFAE